MSSRGLIARLFALLLPLLLGACAGGDRRDAAPVEKRSTPAQPVVEPTPAAPEPAPAQAVEPSPRVDATRPAEPETPAAQPAAGIVRHGGVGELLKSARAAQRDADWDRAQAMLERALRLAPGDYELWYELALTHYRSGDFDQALQLAHRTLSLSPPLALAQRTRTLLGRIGRARGVP